MSKQKHRTSSKVAVIIMAMMMVIAFMPANAFAAKAAKDINVFITVSDQGEIAAAGNGDAMAWKRVVAKDADKNGKITYNEALIAAHDTWFEGGAAAGYATGDPYGYGSAIVTKLWGHETTNVLFFTNGEGLATGVMDDVVKDGDLLVASINKDQVNYADWYSTFDTEVIEAYTNTDITVTLKGHLGMAYTPEEKVNVPLKNISIGKWTSKDKPFEPIQKEGQAITTDDNGQVTLNFTDPGFYIITAEGTVPGESWTGEAIDCPIIAPVCLIEVKNPNTMTIGETKTVTAKAKKTTKIAAAKAFSVENPVGKVTYKKKSGNKKITVAKNGTVTVKKGLKKGKTYTVKVNVTAAGDENYYPASDVATVKIKIK